MKKLRRWPRLVLVVVYAVVLLFLANRIWKDYVLTGNTLTSANQEEPLVFGLSVVQDKPSTLLTELRDTARANDWSTSFFLQSQSPSVQVFLDYIAIREDMDLPSQVCFSSVHLSKNAIVPLEVISQVNFYSTLGTLDYTDQKYPNEYVFPFNDNKLCLQRGSKYFLPHIFLGVISSQTYANLGFTQILGQRAFEFFPFEQQNIPLDVRAYYMAGEEEKMREPILEATISQQGWIGKFTDTPNQPTTLHLSRPMFYRAILIIFFVIMFALILLLNDVVEDAGGFFEIAFGLLLGLWGTHEILIPNYIESSVPIDVMIYILYILVIGEIVLVFLDELLIDWKKHRVNITGIVKGALDQESVTIENLSSVPIEITGWVLSDEVGHKFKFPRFILNGKRRVKIWTADRGHSADAHHHFHWGRRASVWNNEHDTAFLEDARGEVIDNMSYTGSQTGP